MSNVDQELRVLRNKVTHLSREHKKQKRQMAALLKVLKNLLRAQQMHLQQMVLSQQQMMAQQPIPNQHRPMPQQQHPMPQQPQQPTQPIRNNTMSIQVIPHSLVQEQPMPQQLQTMPQQQAPQQSILRQLLTQPIREQTQPITTYCITVQPPTTQFIVALMESTESHPIADP